MDGIEQGGVQGENGGEAIEAPGPNPAWNDVLSVLPEQFHGVVTPHFQKWDQAAQSRIEAANAKVKDYEPYQGFVDHGIEAGEIENSLRLMYEINNNPQKVWEALAQTYNLGAGTGNEQTPAANEGEPPNFQDPRFNELQQGIELVSQIVLQDQQAKASAKADAEVDSEIESIKAEFADNGGIDERFILGMMRNGLDATHIAQTWTEMRNGPLQNNPLPFAPNVMGNSGGGTGLPSQAIDPTKLSGKGTRDLVAQMLAAEFGQRN